MGTYIYICYGLAWILGFNGLLAKEGRESIQCLITVEVPIKDHYLKARSLKGTFSGFCLSSSKNLVGIHACLGFGYEQNKRSKNMFFPPREFVTTSLQIHGFVARIHTICVAPNTSNQKFGFNWSWIGNALRHLANTF